MRDLTEKQQDFLASLHVYNDRSEYSTLSDGELGDIINDCIATLCTMNGDSGPITLTERQVAILLKSFIATDGAC